MTASATNLNSLVELDFGTIDKKNATQTDLFLKMTCFNIPSTIARDAAINLPKLFKMARQAQETGYAGVKRNNLCTVYRA